MSSRRKAGVPGSPVLMRPCVIALAAAVACSGKPPPTAQSAQTTPAAATTGAAPADAAALDQDLPRLVDRSLVMYQDVAKALAASGDDCAAAAGKLRQLAGTYREVVAANAKVLHDGRAKQLRAALDPHSEAFDRSAQAIVSSPTMSACSQDPAFAKAFDELLEAPP
jgi:ABC-type transporter Mla subunit MlaD